MYKDNWEQIGNAAIEGGLPFLWLIIKQFFRNIFTRKEEK